MTERNRLDLSYEEFDSWVICPKCETAMIGYVGEECFLCPGVKMQATPLYPAEGGTEVPSGEAILAELGIEYTPTEREVLHELGL